MYARRLNLLSVTAWTFLLVPIIVVSTVDACPRSHGHYKGGHTTGNCNGRRVGPVTWLVRSSHPLVHRGERHRTFVEVHLRGNRVKNVRRRPLNVALVLDRSGSMRGAKMADAREAALRMVRQLEPGDVVSVVSYSDNVRVDWPAKVFSLRDEKRLLNVIRRLRAGGSTFLEGGMRAGAQQAARFMDDRRVTRVLLMSDGNANVGVRSGRALGNIARRIARDGMSTATIGLGLDYNEDTMTAIADGGAGSYYYVRRSRDLAGTIKDELRSMMATAARRIVVRLRTRPGVRVRQVHGYDAERGQRGISIPVPDLPEHGERSILVELDVRSSQARRYDRRPIIDVQLSFADIKGRRWSTASRIDVHATDDRRQAEQERDWAVLKRWEEHRIARAMADSARLVAEGRGREAKERIQRAVRDAEKVQRFAKDEKLDGVLKAARRRAAAAPAASTADRSAREHYKKSIKAQAYSLSH